MTNIYDDLFVLFSNKIKIEPEQEKEPIKIVQSILDIDICIPFYLYNQCPLRMIVTKLILNHYSNIFLS
jgi:hypothetical protein